MTKQNQGESREPECPKCGGVSFTFKEIFGPTCVQEMVESSYRMMAEEESRICKDLAQLEAKFNRAVDQIERPMRDRLQKLKKVHSEKLNTIAQQVEKDIADADEGEGVLGYLMGDEEMENLSNRKHEDLEKQYIAQRETLMRSLSTSRQEFLDKAHQMKTQLRASLDFKTDSFLDNGVGYTLALVYCQNCGSPVGACPSPRVSSGMISRQTRSLMALLTEQQSIAEQRALDSLNHLARIEACMEQGNRLTAENTKSTVQAVAHLAGVLKGISVSTFISGIANIDEAVDNMRGGFGGDHD